MEIVKMKKEKSPAAQVAAAIKKYVKSLGVECRVSSSYFSMGNSVDIYIEDQPPEMVAKIKEFASQYQYGSFNGYEDLYEYTNKRNDIPQAKYVTVNNRMSDKLAQAIYEYVLKNYSGMEGAPDNYKDGCNFRNVNFNDYASGLVYRLYSGQDSGLYDELNNKKEAA